MWCIYGISGKTSCPVLSCPSSTPPHMDIWVGFLYLRLIVWCPFREEHLVARQIFFFLVYGTSAKMSLSCPIRTPPPGQDWMDIWTEIYHVWLNTVSQRQTPMANVLYIWHLRQDVPVLSHPDAPLDRTEWTSGLRFNMHGWIQCHKGKLLWPMYYIHGIWGKTSPSCPVWTPPPGQDWIDIWTEI